MNRIRMALALAPALAMLGCGGGGSSLGTINIRAVDFVRGATSINVAADTLSLGTALAYGSPTGYMSLSNIPQAVSANDPGTAVSLGSTTLNTVAGNSYTAYVYGVEGSSPAPTLTILQDSPPTASLVAANIRVGNFSSTVPGNTAVDVYFTPTSTASLTGLVADYTGVAYGSVVAYTQLTGSTVKIWFTPTGVKTTTLATTNYPLANGSDYSIYLSDGSPSGAGPQVTVVLDTY